MEVRRCGDGHPPFTERERAIRLNGTGGVKILEMPESKLRLGHFCLRLTWVDRPLRRITLVSSKGLLDPSVEIFRLTSTIAPDNARHTRP
ncbi:MAG: hypothetical protein DMF25_03645 [Verrucomicrobia bacterium]|nr:MAG: hypothetical protein DMF25_03645 [Verrucomicrobiota bacterium]